MIESWKLQIPVNVYVFKIPESLFSENNGGFGSIYLIQNKHT